MANYDGSLKFDTKLDTKNFQKDLGKLGEVAKTGLKGVIGTLGAAGAALSAGAIAGVKYNSQMEQYITSFGTMLGSAEKATDLVNKLKVMGAKTPFETSDLAKGAQTLLAFGTAEQKLLPTMQMIGDVSQGNKERFDSLTLAFGQMSSAGKLQGQDLLQMINAGFNPLNEISKKTGESMSQLRDRMEKGAISADEVADAFKSATSEGGMFYGAMDAQSKTFAGQLSTLKDNSMVLLGSVTTGLQDLLKTNALPIISSWISELQKAFDTSGLQGVVSAVGDILAKIVTIIAEYTPQFIEVSVEIIKAMIIGLSNNSNQLLDAGAEILSTLATALIDNLDKIINAAFNIIISLVDELLKSDNLSRFISAGGKLIENLLIGLSDGIPKLSEKAGELVGTLVAGLSGGDKEMQEAGKKLVLALIKGVFSMDAAILDIPTYIIEGIKKGVDEKLSGFGGWFAKKLSSKLVEASANLFTGGYYSSIGADIIRGIVAGITGGTPKLKSPAAGAIDSILQAMKKKAEIHSPSRVMRDEVGRYIVEGIAEGITNDMSAEEAAEKKAQNIVNAFKDAIDNADLDSDAADLEHQLWEKLSDGNASDGEKNAQKSAMLSKQLAAQSEKVNLAQAEYNTLYDTIGASDEQTKNAYNNLLKEKIAMADLTDQVNELNDAEAERAKNAKTAYDDYLQKNQAVLLKQGVSQADIESAARRVSGYGDNEQQPTAATPAVPSSTTAPVTPTAPDAPAPQSTAEVSSTYDESLEEVKKKTDDAIAYITAELEKAGLTIPDGFFDCGKQSADNFGGGFISQLGTVMDKIRTAVQSNMSTMMPQFALADGGTGTSIQNITNVSEYNFYSSNETTSQQLQTARNAAALDKLRGTK